MMGFRATRQWKSMATQLHLRNSGCSFSSSTSQKSHSKPSFRELFMNEAMKPDFAPVWIVAGFVSVAIAIGVRTAYVQIRHAPGVSVTKRKRCGMSEIDNPDGIVAGADKYINKSFLRQVSQIQQDKHYVPGESRPDPFTRPRKAVTLKTVGIDPPRRS